MIRKQFLGRAGDIKLGKNGRLLTEVLKEEHFFERKKDKRIVVELRITDLNGQAIGSEFTVQDIIMCAQSLDYYIFVPDKDNPRYFVDWDEMNEKLMEQVLADKARTYETDDGEEFKGMIQRFAKEAKIKDSNLIYMYYGPFLIAFKEKQ